MQEQVRGHLRWILNRNDALLEYDEDENVRVSKTAAHGHPLLLAPNPFIATRCR